MMQIWWRHVTLSWLPLPCPGRTPSIIVPKGTRKQSKLPVALHLECSHAVKNDPVLSIVISRVMTSPDKSTNIRNETSDPFYEK